MNYGFLTTETNSKALCIFCCFFNITSVKLFVVTVQIFVYIFFVYNCVFRKKEKKNSQNLSHFENENTFLKRKWNTFRKRITFWEWKFIPKCILKMKTRFWKVSKRCWTHCATQQAKQERFFLLSFCFCAQRPDYKVRTIVLPLLLHTVEKLSHSCDNFLGTKL